jgi:hypothetical protein
LVSEEDGSKFMQLDRIRGALSYVICMARRNSPEINKTREDELVRSVLEFGGMKSHLYGATLLDETEVSFRLRETPSSVRRTFARLEECCFVERTALPQLWKISLQESGHFAADPDPIGRDGTVSGNAEIKETRATPILAKQDSRTTGA